MRHILASLAILSLTLTQNHADEAAKCGASLKKAIRNNPNDVNIDKSTCPKSNTLLMWLRAKKTASSAEAQVFLEKHLNWPGTISIQHQIETELLNHPIPATQTISWFRQTPPISIDGLTAFGKALVSQKQRHDQKFRQAFLEIEMPPAQFKKIFAAFAPLIDDQTLAKKIHTLIDKNQLALATQLKAKLQKDTKAIVEARLAVLSGTEPKDHLNNPHVQFQQIRLYSRLRDNQKASNLLIQLTNPENPEAVWPERNLIGRRLLEEQKYQAAYNTLRNHGLKKGENFANAEWLAGWISLRFLKNPEQAKEHFERLNENVSTPVSVARAQYWLARTYQDLGNKDAAKSWFEKAKQHIATYYGQLAYKELTGEAPNPRPTALKTDKSAQSSLESKELYAYIRLLQAIGEHNLAETFALKLGEQLKTPTEQAHLAELIRQKSGNHQGLKVYKKIMKAEYPLTPAGYPRINIPNGIIDPAFAHAIIRQESRFQADAVSSAGATGLMQLMPATATQTEKRYKIKKQRLTNPHHNLQVGCHYLQDMMTKYQGSLILAAAAYNAGDTAVDSWIEQFGDPRSTKVNTVDWIELIPYAETRNYVQRVMENYHCYR